MSKDVIDHTHNRKQIWKSHHAILGSFVTTTRVHLSHFQKVLIAESAARRSSNWENF